MVRLRAILGLLAIVVAGVSLALDLEAVTRWATPIVWWGYILVLDAGLTIRRGRSPFLGDPLRFAGWTTASIAVWLIFEAYNLHIGNWHYLGLPDRLTVRLAGYVASFSTILPGVLLTADWLTERRWFTRRDAVGPRRGVPLGAWSLSALVATGAICLVFPLLVPAHLAKWGFGLVWLGFFFVLDPLNAAAGRPSLLDDWRRGLWGRTGRLLLAGAICGLLWESVNWGAATKWIYTVPVFPEWTLFEMPLAGFLGFPAFALELFAFSQTLAALAGSLRLPASSMEPPSLSGLWSRPPAV